MATSSPVERYVVDDRLMLLGLDELYRDAMQRHERSELLECARMVAGTLGIGPADVPIEGYYADDELLTEYFRLMRSLQVVEASRTPTVDGLREFHRLVEVVASPLFGVPVWDKGLLPVGRDALSAALYETAPDWSIERLSAVARRLVRTTDDMSLVGLAAWVGDSVVLASLRESVVLYADEVTLCAGPVRRREFVWQVDGELARRAGHFVDTFNALFDDELPRPIAENAASYWRAGTDNIIVGRCVRLGVDPRFSPPRHYHWAVGFEIDGKPTVHEFWSTELWTTERYRGAECPANPGGLSP
jgi:hypothetical protein